MTIQELLPLLHQLSRADKLRVLQYVANDLATAEIVQDDQVFPPVQEFRLYTPYGNEAAARQLQAMLRAANPNEKSSDGA
ncbi:MAG: hypothetical protein K8L91_30175 [Anaerolineae bacterium]|nr:hypothetical protein [Anaerolineae bacterium]